MNINKYNLKFDDDRIGRLVKEESYEYNANECIIDSPEKAAELIEKVFDGSNLTQEYFWLIALNGRRYVTGVFVITIGTLISSLVHPREVFLRAILSGAASIIVIHNHPSGTLNISENDHDVTKRLRQAGEIIGIPLDDHIIVANNDFVSVY